MSRAEAVTAVEVRVDFGGEGAYPVGHLEADGRRIFFTYDTDFLARGHNLSPIRLPLRAGPQAADTKIFDGLPGVFADSLPDGWGRLLVDRAFAANGQPTPTPLHRLSLVGDNGPGALTYQPARYAETTPLALDPLADLAQASVQVLAEQDAAAALRKLLPLGGSSGGARPKILVGYHPATGRLVPDAAVLPEGFEHWIIKFATREDGPQAARVEQAYALMARAAGLEVAPTRLFDEDGGRAYFGTRRFDRPAPGRRLHFHSAAGLLHDNFRLPAIDYGHLIDATLRLTKHRGQALDMLRLATFNVLAHNRDDHSKNFGFLLAANGAWRLASAYDLTFAQSGHGEHSITVAGEGRAPGRAQLQSLADAFDLRGFDEVYEQVAAAVRGWSRFAEQAGVGRSRSVEIAAALRF